MLLRNSIHEMPATLRLAMPIVAGFVGQMLMGWADSIMVGRVGAVPLAACAFGNTIASIFFVFGFGTMSAVSVCAANSFGAGAHRKAGEFCLAGVVLGVAFGVVLGAVMLGAIPLYFLLGQPEEVVSGSLGYIVLVAFSLLPTMVFCAGKAFGEALSRPWMPFWVMISGVLLNVFLNWVFIFGNLGAPPMGLTGAGLATLLSRIAVALAIFFPFFLDSSYAKFFVRPWNGERVWGHLPALLRIGMPSGFQVLGEVTAFAFAALMLGWIGIAALAAHQIAITCAATTFMIPLGVSIALTVRLGQALGAGDRNHLRSIAGSAIGISLAVMLIGAGIFLGFGQWIASWFVQDREVILLAAKLLVVAGIFQVFDGVQVVSVGGLRGLQDVRIPMVLTYFHYWGVALPLAWILAFPLEFGAVGIWAGLAAGLAAAALVLGSRLWIKTRA